MKIITIDNKNYEKFLRTNVPPLVVQEENLKELRAIAKEMRVLMHEANGVGLAANQVHLSKRLFITELPDSPAGETKEKGYKKFYAVLNPVVTKSSKETSVLEEGCLSIPGVFGDVERAEAVTVEGYTLYGKKTVIKARGLLARVFGHEIDHLNGVLFTDKAKNIHRIDEIQNEK